MTGGRMITVPLMGNEWEMKLNLKKKWRKRMKKFIDTL